ncbi:MAG: HXXEE domain-containing protein [Gordonia amarae]
MTMTAVLPQSTGVRLGQAFVRTHFPTDVIVGVAAIALFIINWDSMAGWERIGYAAFIVLCVHQLEEYRFPGGFVWGLNMTMSSKIPDRYPGNALSATFVDVATTIIVGLWLFLWPSTGLVAFLILFSLLEVIGHTAFGIIAYRRYRGVGKTTIYFPGNLTAYFGFGPLVIVGFHEFTTENLLTGGEWGFVVLALVAFVVIGLGLPTTLGAREDSPFTYPVIQAQGYYLRRYEQLLIAAGATPTATTDRHPARH